MLGAGSSVPMIVTRLSIGWVLPSPGAYPMDPSARVTCPSRGHARQFHSLIGVNPWQTTLLDLGSVSSRVALLPRSAELQPLILRFVFTSPSCSPNCPGCLHFQWSPPLEMDGFQMRGKLSRVSTFSEAGGHACPWYSPLV
jgi:hypothetical protein